ncbi:amidohydrolase family protein [Extibacter muris]|uniref:amidohydrolase family protein n=1 Tax=Extibacter muris TaxID=1796622 RepID=UPI001D07EB34|nr:amidohydrolase family protein [Extibacter muris]MCB6201983.1 amidohydrolase family protein [Extibacter muris]MCQ4663344.1 amidohydrolase family protein [Extibacter muris]MCQ4692616.1 amidohydrolase family protein [Extibacter muris]
MKDDYIIRNGQVIDPAAGYYGIKDIYVRGGHIVKPSEDASFDGACVIDAADCLVLPGLIDFHTHLGYQLSDFGLHPDLYTLPNGVTAAVDAGSGGTANFEGMYTNVFSRSMIDIKCFLNVTATGIITECYLENLNPDLYNISKIEYLLDRYRHALLGLKVRIGADTAGALELRPLEKAVELGERFGCRVCVHATNLTCGYDRILSLLRPGDIICHIFQGDNDYTILGEDGGIADCVREGRKRGVLFDCACGRVNYSNRIIRQALKEGFVPDIISTDVIGFSIYGPKIHSLLSVMSQYLGAGMELMDVVRAATATPAGVMGMEGKTGTLEEGAQADIFITRLMRHKWEVTDKFGEAMQFHEVFVPLLTMKNGKLAYRNILYDSIG